MITFLENIKFLIDKLERKEMILDSILNITINQQSIITSGTKPDELNLFFKEMNKEKQNLILEIANLDKEFQKVFIESKSDFENKSHLYKTEVQYMQQKIKSITYLDSKIKVEEEKNRTLSNVNNINIEIKKIKTVPTKTILEKYKKHSRKKIKK